MAHDNDAPDAEIQTEAINEGTPLLVNINESGEEQVNEEEEEPKQVTTASWYIWRMFWFIVTALVLALFIKGWIDAGSDVNVGFATWKSTSCPADM